MREALRKLSADPAQPLTAAALAREAGIGRNALYTGHADVLGELRALAAQRAASKVSRRDREADGEDIRRLEKDKQKLATQNAGLLRRALDAEERLKRSEDRNAQLLREIAKLRAPAVVPRGNAGQPGRQD
ncbi:MULTISPECIES: hypothetical protein [unclassified Marinovum]|uniref:hypothetical protein n=1 Tax=unclassified Marinovum TaxID=2647166 RepID=UPI003EDBF5B3